MIKYPKNTAITLAIDLLILIIGVLNILSIIEKAQIPFSDQSKYSNSNKFINKNDILVSIDNLNVKSLNDYESVIDKYKAGDFVDISVLRNGNPINLKIQLTNYYDTFFLIITYFVMLVFLIPALLIYFKTEDRILAEVFHWLMLSVVVMLVFTYGSLKTNHFFINLVIRVIDQISYLTLSVLFLHFSFIVPRKKIQNLNKYFQPVYIFIALVSIPLIWINYNYLTKSSIEIIQLHDNIHYYFLKLFFIPCFVIIIYNFVHSYLTTQQTDEKQILLWIFVGLFWSPFVYVFLYRIPGSIAEQPIISETFLELMLIISPLTLFIAIFKYRFLNIQLLIKRSFVYGCILTFLLIIYIIIILISTQILSLKTEKFYNIPNTLAALIIIFLFQPAKIKVQNYVDKKFFKVNYDIKQVEELFLIALKECITINDISALIFRTISNYIPVKSINFLNYINTTDDLVSIDNLNNQLDQTQIYKLKEAIKKNLSGYPISKKKELPDEINIIENLSLINSLESSVIFCSFSENKDLICVLILGTKKSDFSFTFEDTTLLNFITIESGNIIQRINLQKKLLFQQDEINKLEELNKIKSYFVSSVSHEFKTPLTSILLFTEILQLKNDLPELKKNEYLEIITGECNRLNRLVDNILDFSKIERGAKEYKFELINLNDVVDSVIKTINYMLKLKKFHLNYSKNNETFKILADEDSLKEIIINLIDNSIKYSTDTKEITISTFKINNYYCFSISDKGIGISDEDKLKIFDAFFRAKDKNTVRSGGAGIGLSLVKNIMDSHNGYIELLSKIGEGSTFNLYFPQRTD